MQSISSSIKRMDISSTATARTDTFLMSHLSRRLIARSWGIRPVEVHDTKPPTLPLLLQLLVSLCGERGRERGRV